MGKKKKQTFIEGIKGLGASPLNEEYQAENDHGSFYGGLELSEDVKRKLEEQPVAEFINFTQKSDGTYQANAKIPEFGMDENGTEYKLREYMNKAIQWSYNKIVQKDGTVKDDILSSAVYMGFDGEDEIYDDLKNTVPKEEEAAFKAFYQQNYTLIRSNMIALHQEASKVLYYNKLVDVTSGSSIEPEDEIVNEYLANAYPDYLNTLKKFESIKNMDPAKEMNIYASFACDIYGIANCAFAEQANAYRQAKGIEGSIIIDSERIDFPDGKINEPTRLSTFDYHVVDHIKANLDGQEFSLSIETTAPPVGQLFYQKSKSPQALGIYHDANELRNTYNDIRNEVNVYKSADQKHIAKVISGQEYKNRELENVPAKLEFGHVKAEILALERKQSKASYGQLLKNVEVFDKGVWGSKEFANMKKSLKALKHVDSIEDYNKKMKQLREDTIKYILYKDPNGNAKKQRA